MFQAEETAGPVVIDNLVNLKTLKEGILAGVQTWGERYCRGRWEQTT